jgi:hypothetical protein
MSLQSDIATALASVASGHVYPQYVEEDIDLPFVVYRITSKDPLQTLDGTIQSRNSVAVFECYADTYAAALTLADDVRTAISGSALTQYEDTAPGEDYEPVIDVFMEPVFFGFWHN